MRKHVLFIVENASYPADPRVSAEAETLIELGYDVSVICEASDRSPLRHEAIGGVEVYRHFAPKLRDTRLSVLIEYANALFWEFLLSIRIFCKKPFQFIHGANPPDHIFLIALLFKMFGTKYVFDHHDLSPEMYVAKFKKKDIFYQGLLLMEKMSFNFAEIVISTNQSYKKVAVERGQKKENKVFVVRNGPRLDKMIWMPPNVSLKNGCQYLVAYLGGIGIQERVDILLHAADYIVKEKKRGDIRFIVVGSGPYLKNIIELSKRMGLEEHVKFTGYVKDDILAQILATADLCVDPEPKTDFSDRSTMLKTMHYMTYGKPIVQFERRESRVTAGTSSVYVGKNSVEEFAQAVLDLLGDEEKRMKMSLSAHRRIHEDLNWDQQKGNLGRAYNDLVGNGHHCAR